MGENTHTAAISRGEAKKERHPCWKVQTALPQGWREMHSVRQTLCLYAHSARQMCDSSADAEVGEYGLHLCSVLLPGVLCSVLPIKVSPPSFTETWVKLHLLRKAVSNISCEGLTLMYFVSLYLSVLICNGCY